MQNTEQQYEVGKDWWFPTLGRWAYPGETISLDKDVAENFMHNEPGLLKPVRQTTQARATNVRAPKPTKKARGRSRP